MSVGQRRQLRIVIAGQQHSFCDVLATNVQRLGYEAVIFSSDLKKSGVGRCDVEGDILLYDVDKVLMHQNAKKSPSHLQQGMQVADILPDWEIAQSRTRLTMVLSSSSVSRALLEQMRAIALLHKPFGIGQLQRYLSVLQRLFFPEQKQGQQVQGSKHEHSMRVLIVDDDKRVVDLVSGCLSAEPGFAVAVAHNGLEALEWCMDWHPQCVVTDLIMPWMNGYQMMHCLSAGMLHVMPAFVVMSALPRLEGPSHRAYLTGRVVTYIDKPFQVDHLLRAIKQVLQERTRNSA